MEAIAEGDGCREQALLQAVGELVAACGRCDACERADGQHQRDWSEQASQVLAALAQQDGLELKVLKRDLAERQPQGEGRWGWLARRLVQEELIAESDDGAQRLYLRPTGRTYLRRPWPLHWAA
jgi:ATP-dependent DNA helicase RecQ